jgi:hypothetical protein
MLSIQGGRSQVIVNGELTKGYEVEKGVRQGEVLSPFLWVAFTDALLAAQKMVGKGVEVGGNEGEEVSVIGSCFMDDAVWYSHDRSEMVQRVEVQAEFCKYHGIKLNMDKSTYTVVKAKEEASPIEVEGKACKMGRPNGYFKYLGVNMSPTGKIKHEVGRLDSKVMEIYDTLDRKKPDSNGS